VSKYYLLLIRLTFAIGENDERPMEFQWHHVSLYKLQQHVISRKTE